MNGSAQVILLKDDEETCFPISAGVEGRGLPGQHFLMLTPDIPNQFKKRNALEVV